MFARLQGETDFDLFMRVCNNKEQIGSWQDVADVLNKLLGQSYGESYYRKKFKLTNEKIAYADEVGKTASSNNAKLEELRKERIKLQTLNIERAKVDRSIARQELFYENIGQYVRSLPLPEFRKISVPSRGVNGEFVLCLSDIHYGSEFTDGLNSYSPKICKSYFEYLAGYIKNIFRDKSCKLTVVNLGDTIQGLIHVSDLKLNDSSVVKSVVDVSRLIASFLNEISAYCEVNYIHVPTANHTQIRALNTKANEIPEEDLEYVIKNYIKDLCKDNPRITVNKDVIEYKDYVLADIAGYNVVLTHGHLIKSLETAIDGIEKPQGDSYDYLIMGHQHGAKTITIDCKPNAYNEFDREVIVCPSFIGTDPYSTKIMKSSSPAVELLSFSTKQGHVATKKILLETTNF